METLKIQIPQGYEVESFDKNSGEIKFKEKPKSVLERIKSVDDLLAENRLTKAQFDKQCESLTDDEKAFRILKKLAVALNEGWTPDWNNQNQAKYYPWFEMGGSSGFRFGVCDHWRSGSDVGSRLCFKSREAAEHVGRQFVKLYKDYFVM